MSLNIVITDEDINVAERVFLDEGKTFDQERRAFIKNLETIDLQAVPGSGKTTALLAKLFIIEKKMPFEDGSGILMLSHTNAAIDEIKRKLYHLCPRLFGYPNFIGTIQSFVDEFLAIPYYANKYKQRPFVIDSVAYLQSLNENLEYCLSGQGRDIFTKVLYINRAKEDLIRKYRFSLDEQNNLILLSELNGEPLVINKPRGNARQYQDYTEQEKASIITYLKKLKLKILREGTLHYDDAYFLANAYLKKSPKMKSFIQKRFSFIFVDEVQDMDQHQVSILEDLFYQEGITNIYQRVGDKNQAIHNSIVSVDSWGERSQTAMRISGSHRLTPETANVVKLFGLDFIDIQGLRILEDPIKPQIIFFENAENVLDKYTQIIEEKGLLNLEKKENYPFRAVGWRENHEDEDKLGIRDYWAPFQKNKNKSVNACNNLDDFLISTKNLEKDNLGPIKDSIIFAFLKLLKIAGKKNSDGLNFTKISFFSFLAEKHEEIYKELEKNLYTWSRSILLGEDIHFNIKTHFRLTLLKLFPETEVTEKITTFLETRSEAIFDQVTELEDPNIHASNGVEVKVGTVHSVKGETHVATLYMECFYEKGMGNYESKRLLEQLTTSNTVRETLNAPRRTCKDLIMQSAKMVYVGFSRPTHLLCFAVHNSRRFEVDEELWDIHEII